MRGADERMTVMEVLNDSTGEGLLRSRCSTFVISNSPASNNTVWMRLSAPVQIISPTMINTMPSALRNSPLGLAAQRNLVVIADPKYAMSARMLQNPAIYASRYMTPCAKLTGKIVARMREYVGLQVVNTGPSAAPTNMSDRGELSTREC